MTPFSVHYNLADAARPISLRQAFGKLITGLQILSDFSVIWASYIGAFYLYTGVLDRSSPQDLKSYLIFSGLVSILYVLLCERYELYQREISLLNIKELRGVFKVGITGATLVLSASFYFRDLNLSRIMLTIAWVASPIVLYFERILFYKFHLLFHQKGWSQNRVVIFGAGQVGRHLAKRLRESPGLGLLPIGFLDDDLNKHGQVIENIPVLGGVEYLNTFKDRIDLVLIAVPSATVERNQELLKLAQEHANDAAIVPPTFEDYLVQSSIHEIGGIPVLRKKTAHAPLVYLITKRIIDIILALTFILILLIPAIVIIALIRLEDRDPALFKQKRVGLWGKEFTLYKFRSMKLDAPKYSNTPRDSSDPRITQIGRWLRRTSLDELPQLYNVLRGDMSLVGPRPEMPFIVAHYTPLQRRRLEAKPGITGVWQISAKRGEPIHENIEYDLFYLENRSLLLDASIIIKTAISVVRGIGAV